MKFQNVTPHDLNFKINGVTYEVPVGESCEIPDRIAFAVALHGLPLKAIPPKPAPAVVEEAAPEPEPVDEAPKGKRR